MTISRCNASSTLPAPTHVVALSMLSIFLAFGCGNDGGSGSNGTNGNGNGTGATNGSGATGGNGIDASPSAFVLATNVFSPDTTAGYLLVTETLQPDPVVALSLDEAIEQPGGAGVFQGPGRSVLVGNAEGPTLRRFVLGDSGQLRLDGEMSFLNEGVTSTARGRPATVQLVSEDKAYFLNADFADIIVFDPTVLEIRERIELSGVAPAAGETGDFGYISFRDGERILITYNYRDSNFYNVLPRTVLVVIDTRTDTVTTDTVEGCGEMTLGARGSDGSIYWATGVHGASVHRTTGEETAPAPCLLRVSAGASNFDEGFREDPRSLAGGAPAGDLVGVSDGRALLRVYDETEAPIDAGADGFALRSSVGWRWWSVDLAALAATELTQDPFRSANTLVYPVEDATYVIAFETVEETLLQLATADEAPKTVLRVPGVLQGGIVEIPSVSSFGRMAQRVGHPGGLSLLPSHRFRN